MIIYCIACWNRGFKVPAWRMAEGVCMCESCHDEAQQRAYESVYQPKGAL